MNRCPACSESFHVEFLLDRHLQTHHAVNDSQLTAKYSADKEIALSHLNLPNYHPSLVDGSYKGKFSMNSEPKQSESNLMAGIQQNIFALNSLSNQYSKGIDLATIQESLSRAQNTLEDSQNIRVKQLFSMTNNENLTKTFESQNGSKNLSTVNISNDRNNNKNASNKEKIEAPPLFKDFEPPAEKPSQNVHTNSKSGVSLKCAYCEAREDFKSR